MPYYMIQVAYAPEAIRTLMKKPHDRTKIIRAAVEKLGGRLEGFWYSFGKYDAVVIVEMPDNASAAALPLAAAAGGAVRAGATTPLLTAQEAIVAMKKAGRSGYRPPGK